MRLPHDCLPELPRMPPVQLSFTSTSPLMMASLRLMSRAVHSLRCCLTRWFRTSTCVWKTAFVELIHCIGVSTPTMLCLRVFFMLPHRGPDLQPKGLHDVSTFQIHSRTFCLFPPVSACFRPTAEHCTGSEISHRRYNADPLLRYRRNSD